MDVKEEAILGNQIYDHWYYVSKGRAMHSMLAGMQVNEVLDVGAGSGIFSKQLLKSGVAQTAICVDPAYLQESEETVHGKSVRFVRCVEGAQPELVLMMDVLEHVEDDLALLETYTTLMKSGGHVLITVPAFQFLWSGHDVFLEHHRRYTLGTMEDLVCCAGLTPLSTRYYFGSLFPLIVLIRWISKLRMKEKAYEPKSDLKPLPATINTILTAIHSAERRLLFPFNRLVGLTVFCLAKKP